MHFFSFNYTIKERPQKISKKAIFNQISIANDCRIGWSTFPQQRTGSIVAHVLPTVVSECRCSTCLVMPRGAHSFICNMIAHPLITSAYLSILVKDLCFSFHAHRSSDTTGPCRYSDVNNLENDHAARYNRLHVLMGIVSSRLMINWIF